LARTRSQFSPSSTIAPTSASLCAIGSRCGTRTSWTDALDLDQARAGAADLGPHADQAVGQRDDLRLGRGVLDDGPALRQAGGHEQVLGPGVARVVEVDPLPDQPVGPQPVLIADLLDLGAHGREALDVDVDRPPPDRAAARRRRDDPTGPGQQRPDDQEGGAHRLPERVRDLVRGEVAGPDPDAVLGLVEVDVGAELAQDVQHLAHVVDDRQVVDDALFARQQRGGQDRQGRVLRSGDVHVAMERDAAGDHETISVHWPGSLLLGRQTRVYPAGTLTRRRRATRRRTCDRRSAA
jgi:hypothetical protein